MTTETDRPHKPGDNGSGVCPHCGRRVHFVPIHWLVPRTENDPRSPGWYRHNPAKSPR